MDRAAGGAGDPVEGVCAVAPVLVAVCLVNLVVELGIGVEEGAVLRYAASLDVALVACSGAAVPSGAGPLTDRT